MVQMKDHLMKNLYATIAIVASVGLARVIGPSGGIDLLWPPETGVLNIIWPPAGIAVALMLLWGYRIWPGIVLGSTLAGIFFIFSPYLGQRPLLLIDAVVDGLGYTSMAILGVVIISRFTPPQQLFTASRNILVFFGAAAVSCLASTILNVTTHSITGVYSWEDYAANAFRWWMADVFGFILVGSLIITWATWGHRTLLHRLKIVELVVLYALLTPVILITFGPALLGILLPELSFLLLPLFIWVALRFSPPFVASTLVLTTLIAIVGTLQGAGPFINWPPNVTYALLQLFLIVISLATFVLNASTVEREHAQQELALFAGKLEERVDERTAQLKRTNRALDILSSSNQALLKATDETTLLQEICQIVTNTGGYPLAWIGYAEQDAAKTVRPVAQAGFQPGYLERIHLTWGDEPSGQGAGGRAIRSDEPVVINNIHIDPSFTPWRDEAEQYGYASMVALPLVAEGQTLGALAIYADQPAAFTEEEVRVLAEMAGDAAFGIMALRTREERQQATVALADSRNMLQLVLDTIPVRVFWKDTNERFLGGNAMLAADAGVASTDELIGKTDYDFSWKAQAAAYQQDDQRVMASGKAKLNYEEAQTTPGGTSIWLRTSKVPLRDANGKVIGILGVYEDITERKRAEEALRRSEELFRGFFVYSPVGLNVFDIEGKVVAVNLAARELFGVASEDPLTGYRLFEDPSVSDETKLRLRHGQVSVEERYIDFRAIKEQRMYTIRRTEQDTVFIRLTYAPYGPDPMNPYGYLTVIQDLTNRKEMEDALRYERAFLATSIDTLPLPVIYVSPAEEIIRMNRASADILHSTSPQDWWNVQLVSPDTNALIPLAQWPALRALHGEYTINLEAMIHFPDGRDLPVFLNAAPIYSDHELAAAIVVFQDITKLKEVDRAKDQFLMVLSHELKTPLTSIKGWAQAAEKMPDVVYQALPIIVRNVDEQMKILENLLLLSRIITGRFTITPEPADLRDIVHAAVENTLQEADAHQLQVIEEASLDPLPMLADPGRLNLAIDNLLYNAIKFTDPGGTLWVRTFRAGDDALLQVQDTGRGIAHEELPYLFRPFTQLKREEKKGGLGLGLSLVRGIVEAHGGTVHAESPGLGQGSTFTIRLPLTEASAV